MKPFGALWSPLELSAAMTGHLSAPDIRAPRSFERRTIGALHPQLTRLLAPYLAAKKSNYGASQSYIL